jgi:hypothetical protein
VAGYVDEYDFAGPAGHVTVPCAVLVVDATADPCGTAGGTYVRRIATLVDIGSSAPDHLGPDAFRLCDSDLFLGVDGNERRIEHVELPC